MKSYNKARQFNPNNFNVIRDLSYMQLYLRQYDSFIETCFSVVDAKPEDLSNWMSLAFGYAMSKNYRGALNVLNKVEERGKDTLKKNSKL